MTHWFEPSLPQSRAYVMTANANGADYEIRVWCPSGTYPADGLPAVYVLDGDGLFGTFAEAVARTSRRPDATNVGPAIVVAIGPADTDAGDTDRRHADYTPGPPAEEPSSGRSTGGAAAFLAFIETELMPLIERDFPADPARRVLFGHSLAGYFALHALTTHPDSFAAYIAVSPSIWWDEGSLRAGLERLESRTPRVLIAVGEWEGELPPWQRQNPGGERALARRARRRMIVRARRLAADLARAVGPANVAFHLFADEDHASVVLVAIARALRFALHEAADDGRAAPGARA